MAPSISIQDQPISSSLEQIRDKLQGILGHIEAVGHTENDKDVEIVSELMDNIRDAVADYQVSGDPRWFLQPSHSSKTGPDGEATGHI